MSCCGQKRARLSTEWNTTPAPQVSPAGVPPRATSGRAQVGRPDDVTLRYLGFGAMAMRGTRSGRIYATGATGSTLLVHPDDVEALLHTRLFVRNRP